MNRRSLLSLMAMFPLLNLKPAKADSRYPTKIVKLVVPYAAGGNTDVVARIYAQRLGEMLGQTVIVENRTGSGVLVGTNAVTQSPADGYTLLFGTSAHAALPSLYNKLSFDPVNDLIPVSLLAQVPMVLSVNPRFPAKDAREFVELLRKDPGKYTFASSGSGGSLHLAAELILYQEKLAAIHVPYRGASPALMDVVSGQVDFIIDPVSTSAPHVKAGRLRALAVTTDKRSSLLPEIKTMKEQGFTQYETSTWNMLFAPAKVPSDVIQTLSKGVMAISREPQIVKRLAELGVEAIGSSQEQAAKYLERERTQWAAVIKAAGIKPE